MHGFRANEVLLQAGYDVKLFYMTDSERRPRQYIHVQMILFVYLERFRRYSTLFNLAGISLLGATF